MKRERMLYSEVFKKNVVEEYEKGRYRSVKAVSRAYGIQGHDTVAQWIREFGRPELLLNQWRLQVMPEADEIQKLRKSNQELKAALADAHVDGLLGDAFLHVACERLGMTVEDFKKKHDLTLSDTLQKHPKS